MAASVGSDEWEVDLEDLRREPTVYLITECENEEEVRKRLKEVCGRIFAEHLDGWYRLPALWPSRRDLETFDQWFEWSFHTVVVDLCEDPLPREEI